MNDDLPRLSVFDENEDSIKINCSDLVEELDMTESGIYDEVGHWLGGIHINEGEPTDNDGSRFHLKSILLSENFEWILGRDEASRLILVPRKK